MPERDYTIIIDKSNSMSTTDKAENRTRWDIVKESTIAIAKKCEQEDPDGITVYLFSGKFRRYDNVTAEKVRQIFEKNDPMGRTDLAGVLEDALSNYLERKAAGKAKAEGETILVITDGEPDNRKAVMRTIIDASRQIEKKEEITISLIQVGNDTRATNFLKALDDQLQGAGAKFDIVNTITIEEMQESTLTETMLSAIKN